MEPTFALSQHEALSLPCANFAHIPKNKHYLRHNMNGQLTHNAINTRPQRIALGFFLAFKTGEKSMHAIQKHHADMRKRYNDYLAMVDPDHTGLCVFSRDPFLPVSELLDMQAFDYEAST